THVEFADRVLPGWNTRERNADVQDEIGEGTEVAGIIGAAGNNGIGIAGIAWGVRLLPIKVVDSAGDASVQSVADGIRWAAEHEAHILYIGVGGLNDARSVR